MTQTAVTTTPAAQAPAKKSSPLATVNGMLEQYKAQIARALPKHMTPDRMARVVLTEVSRTPKLLQCDSKSLLGAVIQCSQLGLEPGGVLGHAYLIPFENRKTGTTEVQLIIGYKGLMDLARRSGQLISLSSQAVYSNDTFEFEYGLDPKLRHIPARTARGEMVAVYAVAILKDGGKQFEVMWKEDVEKVRLGSKNANFGPWKDHYDEMARKTVIRRLAKYLPVSIELQKAVAMDELGEAEVSQGNAAILDAEFEVVEEDRTVSTATGEVTAGQASLLDAAPKATK